MKKKIILYSGSIVPKQEFIDFAKMLGYEDYKSLDCRLDENMIKFVESKLEPYYENYVFYKGEKSNKKMCGFDGVIYIQEIDLKRKWTITSEHPGNTYITRNISLSGSYEDIMYLDIIEGENNYVKINYSNVDN